MRKQLLVAIAALFLALPLAAQDYSGCCYNGQQNLFYPAGSMENFGPLDEHGCVESWVDVWSAEPCPAMTPVPATPVPTAIPPPADGGFWGLIKAWADKVTLWKGDVGSVAKIIAMLFSFLGIVQALKKLLENAAKWEWLLKLIPQLAVVFSFLAHGIGPIILNALITGGTMLIAALQDGALSLGEVLAVVVAVVGVDLFYRLIRKYLFPKTA